MKRGLFFILSFALSVAIATAESIPFNGLLCDMAGLGIKTQITITGSEQRKDGKFGFTNLKADDVIEIRYKKSRIEVAVEGRKSAKIVLTDDYKLHAVTDEQSLVDAGNDYVTRRELPTKGGVLTAEMIEREGFSNLADALRAKATSLVIDGAGNVTIRGVNSIGNHANALIICDGMEIGSIHAININDVASVEIQRDGTLYGFKGVGGVIAIKTKSGSKR